MSTRPNVLQPAAWFSLLAAILIVMLSTIISYRTWTAFQRHNDQLAITRQVEDSANALLSALKDAESGQREYLLTGEDQYLDVYRQALEQVPLILQNLGELEVNPGPEPADHIEKLRNIAKTRLDHLQTAIELRRNQGLKAAIAQVGGGQGRMLMAQVRGICREIVTESDTKLKKETAAARDSMNLLGLVSTAGSGTLLVLLLFATVTIRQGARSRQQLIRNLELQQEFLTTFVRAVPAAVAMLDVEMRYLQASDRWCSDYGLDGSRLAGASHYDIFPDIPEAWKQIHRRCLEGETLGAEEDYFDRRDGRRMWLRWEVRPWGKRNGKPEGILIFSEDVTQRKKFEETVREQRAQLDKISATAPGAICLFRLRPDGSMALPYASSGFRRMLPEVPDLRNDATPLFAMLHPIDAARCRNTILDSARTLTPWREEYRVQTPTSGIRWFEGHSVPERQADGTVEWYGFLVDITERKRLDEALREREAVNQALFDSAAQGIVGVNTEGKIELINQMAATIFGYERRELIGQPVESLVPVDLRERHVSHRQGFSRTPKNRSMGKGTDLQGVRRDGTVFPIEVSLTHLQTSRGMLVVSFLTDITVRKQAELALRTSELELHRLAGNLLRAQEDERRRIARDLHDDVTQELGLLSSEIDQLIMDNPPAVEMHQQLSGLLRRVERILGEIRRVSHGLHPTIIEDLGLKVALRELCAEFRRVHRIPVGFESPPEEPEWTCEIAPEIASSLYRIGQECLQNVAKHARASEVLIHLERTGSHIELTVSDDGIGFSSSEWRKGGLGLVSIKERLRAVNGELSIQSEVGKGTRIRAWIPLAIIDSA
ncbi:MAG TPA: PAS domain S-box protein [Bryobacteraceae bacterium]|jgi:PAS domain S-box-containing protein